MASLPAPVTAEQVAGAIAGLFADESWVDTLISSLQTLVFCGVPFSAIEELIASFYSHHGVSHTIAIANIRGHNRKVAA